LLRDHRETIEHKSFTLSSISGNTHVERANKGDTIYTNTSAEHIDTCTDVQPKNTETQANSLSGDLFNECMTIQRDLVAIFDALRLSVAENVVLVHE